MYEKIYVFTDEQCPNSKEKVGYWFGINQNIGDALTYDVLIDGTCHVVQYSVVRSSEHTNGANPDNLCILFVEEEKNDYEVPHSNTSSTDNPTKHTSKQCTIKHKQ